MKSPRILIPLPTYDELTPAKYGVNQSYINAIVGSGGIPLCIARPSETSLHELLPLIDGILLVGGWDIDPERYGEHNTGLTEHIKPERDRVECTLVQFALTNRIPLLGICRGMQVINVALGGSLYQDLLTEMPGALNHDHGHEKSGEQKNPRAIPAHDVAITAETLLATITGQHRLTVNSLHHQGVKTLGNALIAGAVAPDGLVEAIELPNHPFLLGVEWHPEELGDEPSQKIFTAFLAATQGEN